MDGVQNTLMLSLIMMSIGVLDEKLNLLIRATGIDMNEYPEVNEKLKDANRNIDNLLAELKKIAGVEQDD